MSIFNIHIVLGTYCPNGCGGCYQTTLQEKNTIETDKAINHIHQLLSTLETTRDVKITFFGGEPMYHVDKMVRIIKSFDNKNRQFRHMIKEIEIPTSGVVTSYLTNPTEKNAYKNTKHLTKISERLNKEMRLPNSKLIIAISYDGVANDKIRNVPSNYIWGLIRDRVLVKSNVIEPDFVSTIISSRHDQFLWSTFKQLNNYDLKMSMKLPHLINNIQEYEQLEANIQSFYKNLGNELKKKHIPVIQLPKLLQDNINSILYKERLPEEYHKEYKNTMWCEKGVNHMAIGVDGKITGCEFLNPVREKELNKDKIDKFCQGCKIEDYCNKPCVKNFEFLNLDGSSRVALFMKEKLKWSCKIRIRVLNLTRQLLNEHPELIKDALEDLC